MLGNMEEKKVIYLKNYKYKKQFNINNEPCSECDKKSCKETCDKADIWWTTFAKKFSEGTL